VARRGESIALQKGRVEGGKLRMSFNNRWETGLARATHTEQKKQKEERRGRN